MPQDAELDKYLTDPIDDSLEGDRVQALSHKVDQLKKIFGRKLLDTSINSEERLESLNYQADELESESRQFEKHPKKVEIPQEKPKSKCAWMSLFTCCMGRDKEEEQNVGILDQQLVDDFLYQQTR